MTLDSDTTRRLSYLRMLLGRARRESELSPPFSFDSINRLHDVAEMFLALAAYVHHTKIPRSFIGYWEILEPKLGRPLAYRAQMQKLNKVRVSLKHYGIEPTQHEIRAAALAVEGLLEDESGPLFGIALESVSLADLVTVEAVRLLLQDADRNWISGDKSATFADLADAFDSLVSDYSSRKTVGHGESIFRSTEDMTFLSPFFRRVDDSDAARFEEAVIESLTMLDHNLMIVGLGIDLRRYGRFMSLTPSLFRTMDGTRHASEHRGIERSQADYDFCRDFVIGSALHLGEFDYEFDLQAGHRAALERDRNERDSNNETEHDKGEG